MFALALTIGTLVTVIEPGTTTGICTRVTFVGEGIAGIPTIWGVEQGGNRGMKAPLDAVRPGCGAANLSAVPGQRSEAGARPVPVGTTGGARP